MPAAFAALVGLIAAPQAFAKVIFNTIDPVAVVADDGRHIVVSGPLACTAGERAYLSVRVTQRTTGAEAEGKTMVTCTGELGHWELDAETQGKELFQPGPATAVAVARTVTRQDTTDAHQWLVQISLVGE